MSRMLKVLATAVAALALTISATPLGSELGSLDAGNSGGGKTGNWCC
jgi:hypothetical protein